MFKFAGSGVHGKEFVHLLASNVFLYVLLGCVIYTAHKQPRTPVFEIDNDTLNVNDIRCSVKRYHCSLCGSVENSIRSMMMLCAAWFLEWQGSREAVIRVEA